MKNIKLTPTILMLILTCPVFADIAKNASTATCDSITIGATSGSAYMDTAWTPNTINLDWYNGDVKQTSTTCTYDGSIALPSNPSPKTGYTFGGWQVRQVVEEIVNILTSLNASIDGNSSYAHTLSDNTEMYTECSANVCYGSGEYSSVFGDVPLNEWKSEFSYGTVYGEASCNNTMPQTLANAMEQYLEIESQLEAGTITEEEAMALFLPILSIVETMYNNGSDAIRNGDTYNKNTMGQNCWCKATGYTPLNGSKQSVEGQWVYRNMIYESNIQCASSCANDCGSALIDHSHTGFRAAVFNQQD